MTTPLTHHARSSAARTYSILIGLTSLLILLQAVWAGIFIREGKDNNSTWVSVHARGADIAILLAVIAAILAFVRLRARRDLVIGTASLAVLLILEAFLGGLIGGHPAIQTIHFPLALALMGLSVWLPLRARTLRA